MMHNHVHLFAIESIEFKLDADAEIGIFLGPHYFTLEV